GVSRAVGTARGQVIADQARRLLIEQDGTGRKTAICEAAILSDTRFSPYLALLQQVSDLLEQQFLTAGRGRRRGRRLLLASQAVDPLHQQKDRECNDGEVKQRLQEGAVVDGHRIFALPDGRQGHVEVAEILAADQIPEWRREDVVDEGCDNLAE